MSEEIIDRLNELLEVERAGVETAVRLAAVEWESYTPDDIRKFGEDEGWACTELRRAIQRYGGLPSPGSGDFAQKVMALENEGERLKLLARGQMWVVKRIDLLLAMALDPQTRAFLQEMQELHLENIHRCNLRAKELAAPPSPPYRGLLYAHLREAHDRLYYGRWRTTSATNRDLSRASDQLYDYLDALRQEVAQTGDAEAREHLSKALEAYRMAEGKLELLHLDHALSYAHHALNRLLRREGSPFHDPEAFESFHDVVSVPFRELT
jgi:hypothetical protein